MGLFEAIMVTALATAASFGALMSFVYLYIFFLLEIIQIFYWKGLPTLPWIVQVQPISKFCFIPVELIDIWGRALALNGAGVPFRASAQALWILFKESLQRERWSPMLSLTSFALWIPQDSMASAALSSTWVFLNAYGLLYDTFVNSCQFQLSLIVFSMLESKSKLHCIQ